MIEAFKESPTEDFKPEANFADLTQPTKSYEVARNFAAMLELVRYNLVVQVGDEINR